MIFTLLDNCAWSHMESEFDYSTLLYCGMNVRISSRVEIKRPDLVKIGSHVAIDSGFYITTAAQIGNYVHIAPYVSIIGGANSSVEISDFATIAAGARLIVKGDEHLGEGMVGPTIPEKYKDKLIGGELKLCKFSAVGTNAVIMPGLIIAEGSVIGAGAILTKSTEPWTIYVGNPARPIKKRNNKKILEFARFIEMDT